MKDGLLVPAEVLFEGVRGGNESLAVQRALGEWLTPGDELFFAALDRANAIRNAILQSEVIAYEIDADADDDNVIEIFARLNQQGVRLRPGDLAAARLTGQMTNFRSKAREVLGLQELRGFSAHRGARGGQPQRRVRRHRSADPRGAVPGRRRRALPGRREEARCRRTTRTSRRAGSRRWTGSRSAVELYRKHGIPSGDWLPYRYLLFPPAIAAARGIALDERWLGWAVAASLWRHYVGEVDTKLQKDAGLAEKGDVQGLIEHVKAKAKRIDSAVPEEEDLLRNIVSEGGVFLALLIYFTKVSGRSFPGGKLLGGAEEPLEVHHIFPRPVLDRYSERDNEYVPDRLGNLTLLTRSDNEELGETPPSEYLANLLAPKERTAHLIPEDPALWHVEQYKTFCEQRERAMASMLHALLAGLGLG